MFSFPPSIPPKVCRRGSHQYLFDGVPVQVIHPKRIDVLSSEINLQNDQQVPIIKDHGYFDQEFFDF